MPDVQDNRSDSIRGDRLVAWIVLGIADVKLLVHLFANRHYGYFVDELYYLACSHHLDWGYVDQPPLIAVITWLERHLFGDSLPAIRFLPALAGACEVALTGLIARELGGRMYACALASIAVLVAPGILTMDNFLSMNAFEPLIWIGCAWLLLRIWKTGFHRLWIWFGILCGVGLENKYSMLIFGAGIALGLLLTPQRRAFANPWLWVAGAIALLIFLPNLIWNIAHHFPFLELQQNIRRSGRDVALNPAQFFSQELLVMNPLAAPLWLAGLWFFFGTSRGKPFRALGWAWVFTALVIVTASPRVYYLFPAFPLLFAAGAVVMERWFEQRRVRTRALLPALMILGGAILAPLAIPVLPPETYIRYTGALHLAPPAVETHRLGPLPQLFADQFGWEEMTAAVAGVYNSLPEPIRKKTAIFGQTYGQAGAIDFFGPKYGLPPAISGHQNYFLWGPRDYTGESMIVMDDREETLKRLFDNVQKVAHVEHPWSMPYNHFDVYYCSRPRQTLQELWPRVKSWD
ncbi:MAG TPA: glycosyltransferase family 39 protein [Bryobacteraceae bacterium]|jgi:4-amino-4-deoxy-L-arabinose transferase-like glycosyltransferase